MSRIEVQGGGIINSIKLTGTRGAPTLTDDWYDQLTGYPRPVNQFNSAMTFTISDSNLANFSDAAVFVHPDAVNSLYADYTGHDEPDHRAVPGPRRSGRASRSTSTCTTTRSPTRARACTSTRRRGPTPPARRRYQAVLLEQHVLQRRRSPSRRSRRHSTARTTLPSSNVLAMNNIFDGSIADRRQSSGPGGTAGQAGQASSSTTCSSTTPPTSSSPPTTATSRATFGSVFADPQFVGRSAPATPARRTSSSSPPHRRSTRLAAKSGRFRPATPSSRRRRSRSSAVSPRSPGPTPPLLPPGQIPGRDVIFRLGSTSSNRSPPDRHLAGIGLLQLPRRVGAGPRPPTPTASRPRAQRTGHLQLRSDLRPARHPGLHPRPRRPARTGVGFGSNPFIDIGAYPVRQPAPARGHRRHRDADARARRRSTSTPSAGSAGTNQTPWTINITFNGPIDPNTINANTVKLVDLGSNPRQPLDQDINLAGKLSYDSATNTLIINLAAAGLTLGTDAYQITLFGSGSPVLTNPQGIALDGENTAGGTSTGAQLALPSGNGYPGGNFFDSFIINTTPPVGAGRLAQAGSRQRYQHRRRQHHHVDPADLRRHGQRAQPATGAGRRPDRDPRHRHRRARQRRARRPSSTRRSFRAASPIWRSTSARTPAPASPTTGGAFPVTVGVDAANTGLVTNTTALPDLHRHLQRRARRPAVAAARRRQRLLRGSGPRHRPERQSVQPDRSQRPGAVRRRSHAADGRRSRHRRPDQVITSLVPAARSSSRSRPARTSIRPHFTAASIQVVNAGPDGSPRHGRRRHRSRSIPTRSAFTLLDKGTGGQGREQITLLDLAAR